MRSSSTAPIQRTVKKMEVRRAKSSGAHTAPIPAPMGYQPTSSKVAGSSTLPRSVKAAPAGSKAAGGPPRGFGFGSAISR